jgi:hypothetical protein
MRSVLGGILILKCSETKKWRKNFLRSKWLNIDEYVAFKRIINCTNVEDLKNGKTPVKIRCERENKRNNI